MHITDEELISIHEGLIYKLARSFYNSDIEDLYQVGVIGLLKAKKNYNIQSTVKFSTYAYEYIYGEMYQQVEKSRGIKISRDVLQLAKQIDKIRHQLTQKQGRNATVEEIALYLEKPIELIVNALNAANTILSIDAEHDVNKSIIETVADTRDEDLIEKLSIEESLNTLNEDEKKIIDLRYYQDLTQSETARVLGMSQVMVSRYEKKSMQKMRSYLSS